MRSSEYLDYKYTLSIELTPPILRSVVCTATVYVIKFNELSNIWTVLSLIFRVKRFKEA